LGTNGIADEMIRFNGFPFLEKEDHAYGVDGESTPDSILRLESLITSTDVKGFPVVSVASGSESLEPATPSEDGKSILLGYIGKTELKFVLDRFRRSGQLDVDTPCLFGPPLPPPPPSAPVSASRPTRLVSNRMGELVQGIEEEEIPETMFERTAGSEGVEVWPWVNQTPMTVSPQLPLEIVMQLFKRMGPRVILVEDHGSLVGLVTVKDVLRFIAMEKPGYHELSWEQRGGLDGLLEEFWSVGRGVSSRVADEISKLRRRWAR